MGTHKDCCCSAVYSQEKLDTTWISFNKGVIDYSKHTLMIKNYAASVKKGTDFGVEGRLRVLFWGLLNWCLSLWGQAQRAGLGSDWYEPQLGGGPWHLCTVTVSHIIVYLGMSLQAAYRLSKPIYSST